MMWIALTLALLELFATWRNQRFGAALVLLALPTYLIRFHIGPVGVTALELVLLSYVSVTFILERKSASTQLSALVSALRSLRLRSCIATARGRFATLALLLLIASLFGVLVSPNTIAALGIWKAYIVEPILFAYALTLSVSTQEKLNDLFSFLLLGASVISIIALVQYITGWGIPEPWNSPDQLRAVSVYGFPNAVGLFTAPAAALSTALLLFSSERDKSTQFWRSAALLLCTLAIIASRSDGALIALIAAIGVLLLFTRARVFTVIAGIAGLATALWYPATRAILLFQDVSGDVRIALWKGTLNVIQAQPLLGAGISGFPQVYDIYRLDSHVELLQYPHNILLNFWVELGVLGVLWVVAALFTLLFSVLYLQRRKREMGMLLLSVLVSSVVYGLVDVVYFKNDLSVLFWFWIAVATISVAELEKRDVA